MIVWNIVAVVINSFMVGAFFTFPATREWAGLKQGSNG
jgi:uncharacterized membrane protein SpoIIM required for sporulation